MIVATVEDIIIAACQGALGRTVRTVESLPSGLSAGELQERMRVAPAVYVAFLGGTFRDEYEAVLDGQFGVFFLGQTGGDEKAARRGTPSQIGAYTMFERAVPALHGLKTEWGELNAKEFNNLFSQQIDKQGLALYSVSLSLPLTFPRVDAAGDPEEIHKFEIAFLQYGRDGEAISGPLPVSADKTIAQDRVIIPQS